MANPMKRETVSDVNFDLKGSIADLQQALKAIASWIASRPKSSLPSVIGASGGFSIGFGFACAFGLAFPIALVLSGGLAIAGASVVDFFARSDSENRLLTSDAQKAQEYDRITQQMGDLRQEIKQLEDCGAPTAIIESTWLIHEELCKRRLAIWTNWTVESFDSNVATERIAQQIQELDDNIRSMSDAKPPDKSKPVDNTGPVSDAV
jgi:hypothetical protein